MPSAWNIASAWRNIAGSATFGASSEEAGMPVTNLQQEDVLRIWRGTAEALSTINITFASNQSADTFALLTTNLTATGTARLKLSATALGNTDIWDATVAVDPNYKKAVWLAPTVKSGWKYMQIQLADAALTYYEAGFLIVDTRTQFDYNVDGVQITWIDPSIIKKTVGGQTKITARPKYRQCDLSLGWVTEAQRWIAIEAMARDNGLSIPVLLILDPSSANLGRDSFYGLIETASPVIRLPIMGDGPMYQTNLKIVDRL